MFERFGSGTGRKRLRPKRFEPGQMPELSASARKLVEDIIEENGGEMPTGEQLYDAAVAVDSPLHKYFDWSEGEDAEPERPEYVSAGGR